MKYIDAEKLKAEIERLLAKAENDEKTAFKKKDAAGHLAAVTKTAVCVKIKKLITSLQQEQTEFPKTDEEVEKFLATAPYVEFVEKLASMELPETPSNLDEAAKKEIERFCSDMLNVDIIWARMPLTKRFGLQMAKFGAEWMAEQGVNADFEVCKLTNRAWLTPINEKRFVQDVFDNFTAGDKVVVQIRKK